MAKKLKKIVKSNAKAGDVIKIINNHKEIHSKVDFDPGYGKILAGQSCTILENKGGGEYDIVINKTKQKIHDVPDVIFVNKNKKPESINKTQWENWTTKQRSNWLKTAGHKQLYAVVDKWEELPEEVQKFGLGGLLKRGAKAAGNMAVKGAKATKKYAKDKKHEVKKNIALDVIEETRSKENVTKEESGKYLRTTGEIISEKFGKGGNVGGKQIDAEAKKLWDNADGPDRYEMFEGWGKSEVKAFAGRKYNALPIKAKEHLSGIVGSLIRNDVDMGAADSVELQITEIDAQIAALEEKRAALQEQVSKRKAKDMLGFSEIHATFSDHEKAFICAAINRLAKTSKVATPENIIEFDVAAIKEAVNDAAVEPILSEKGREAKKSVLVKLK